ncbi:MAG: hypothetical protein F6K47_11460 [Symploca sp. SIO2E6]|nr:hypothetical protein [Symploca sp. SIO2E6]
MKSSPNEELGIGNWELVSVNIFLVSLVPLLRSSLLPGRIRCQLFCPLQQVHDF